MSAAELRAYRQLALGNLEPIADILAKEKGDLHPILQRLLVKLIRGSAEEADYRLVAVKHPELTRSSQGPAARAAAELNAVQIALRVMENGGLRKGEWEAAVRETMRQTGQSRSTITKHWREQGGFVRFSLSKGHIADVDKI